MDKNEQQIHLFPIIPFDYLDLTYRNENKKIEIFFRLRILEAIKDDPKLTLEECCLAPTIKVKDEFKEAIGEKIKYGDIDVDFINDLFLEKEIYPFDKKVGHCDAFLYRQIEYFILKSYKNISPDLRERKILERNRKIMENINRERIAQSKSKNLIFK